MNRGVRILLTVVSIIQAGFALAFILQVPVVIGLWPLPYTNATSYLFIGSIFAAAAASTLWCLLVREDQALVGIALDYLTILIPLAILMFQFAGTSRTRRDPLMAFGMICVLGALFGLWLLLWSRRQPVRDTRPLPRVLPWVFAFFVIALLIAGGRMILKSPNVLPWNASLDGQILYGWMFLGAAAYFAYGLVRRGWYNAGGQLAGFLAYDLVLIGPFLSQVSTITPSRLPNLLVYIGVLAVSGALAIFYLVINPPTRMWRPRQVIPAAIGH